MPLKDTPIQRKLMTILLLTSGAVLLITCVGFFACEILTFRRSAVRELSTLGEIIAANSTAALAFDNQDDAREILSALQAERHIVGACLYNKEGKPFTQYPPTTSVDGFPVTPEKDGYRFEQSHLSGFQAVVQNGKRMGTLYLRADMGAMYERLRLFGGIALLVIAVSLLVAYLISRTLQRQISQPILALAETAKSVSDRRDYSVRATKRGEDELGLLTDAFNQMLTQIQEQSRSLLQLAAIVESSGDAIISKNLDGIITSWNAGSEKLFGYSQQEAVGKSMLMLFPSDRVEEESEILARIKRGGGIDHFETVRARKDGEQIDVSVTLSPIRDGQGKIIGASKIARDITERKRVEAAVRQSEVRYRTLFDTMIEGFCTIEMIFNTDGKPVDYRFLEINPAFERQTGLQNAQGKLMRDLAPDLEEHWFEIYGRIAVTGEPKHFENEAKALGRHYDVCAYRIGGPESRKVAILFNDITERKQTETKLQAQLGRLDLLQRITRAIGERQDLPSIFQVVIRSLEDNLPLDFGCVCLYEPTAEVLTVTSVGVKSAALAMELALTEQARIPIDQNGLSRCVRGELVHEPDISQVKFPFPQRLMRGSLRSLVAAPLLVESKVFGVLIAARHEANSFSSPDCEFLRQLSEHVALAAHQAQINSALQQAYNDLRQSQQTILQQERLRALGQMASGIAHDINNAISPVALYTESLLEREPNLSERARDYLTTIQNAIEDVAQTVARMREFYRQREPQLTLAPVHFNHLIQQVLDLTRARWNDIPQERGLVVRLQTELQSDLPPTMGAEGEIRDALTNLILNAVDAMPEGGTLTLRTRTVDHAAGGKGHGLAHSIVAEVSDTGLGMDEETRRRCVEPFFTTKGERGTGLGLAMVYGMVERHSAELEIESELGRGTTIRLVFPIASTVETASVRTSTSTRPLQRLRILVVDDDPLLIKSLRDTLESDGHLVTAADGGQAGINAFEASKKHNEPFAIVITDLGMPYVDGRRVAASIKAGSPATPVIMLTGWGQRLVAEGDIPPHVDRVLNKPPKLRELRAALAELVTVSELPKQP